MNNNNYNNNKNKNTSYRKIVLFATRCLHCMSHPPLDTALLNFVNKANVHMSLIDSQ